VLGIVFAVLSALGFGAGQFLIQLGLRGGRVGTYQGLFINLLAATVTLLLALVVSWVAEPIAMAVLGLVYFACAGFMAPLFGRGSNFIAIRRIGATRTASLGMTESFFAAVIAYAVLGQTLSRLSVAGILVLVVGTMLFINESSRIARSAAQVPKPESQAVTSAWVDRQTRSQALLGITFAVLSGLFFAVAGVLRKLGLDVIPSSVLGAAVGTVVAFTVASVDLLRRGQLRGILRVERRDAVSLASSGMVASAGMLCFLLSLQLGVPVAISTALKNTTPLVTFGLAAMFMARRERVSVRLGMLVLLVVIGGIITAVGRA
jgi:drug/metabolite transporter (DMT)-like permease